MGEFLLVVASGIYVLAFLTVDDGGTGVLAEGELALGSHLGIAEHCEGHELVVFARFRVMEDFGHHFVVLAAEHECVVVSTLTCDHGESLGVDNEEFVTSPVFNFHVVGGEMIVLGSVGAEGEHLLIFKRFCRHCLELI